MVIRTSLAVSCSALALMAAGSACPARAQTPDTAEAVLDEVIVVARKRAENVQSTPVAVTAITGEQLQQRSVQSFRDLQQQTPSLRMVQASTSAASSFVSIRGQAYADIQLTADPAVGIYVDGVYIPRLVGTETTDLNDVDRVEVLKGAQGTLFGRNTTGGAISVFTKGPTDRFEGQVNARLANLDSWLGGLVLNIPVAQDFGVRLVAQEAKRGGTGVNLFNGRELGDSHTRSWRATAEWTPTDDLTVTLRADHSRMEDTGSAIKPMTVNPTGSFVNEIIAETGLSAAAARASFVALGGGSAYDATLNTTPDEKVRGGGVSATVDWKVGDSISVKSITANRRIHRASATDLDGSPYQIFDVLHSTTRSEQFSQEFQVVGDAMEGRLDWIGGLFFSREVGDSSNTQVSAGRLSPNPTVQQIDVKNVSKAVFGQATFHMSDALAGTVGVRYNRDSRELTSASRTPTRCLATGLPLAGACSATYDVNYENVSYTLSLEYQATRDILAYAKTNRAYRSGGLPNGGGSAISPEAAFVSFTPFLPERVQDYELGLKTEWFDRTFRANLAAFHVDYRNIQLSHSRTVPGTSLVISVIDNAAVAKIDGVELETLWRPTTAVEFRANGAYTNARFTEGSTDKFRFTPKWSYSLSGAYTHPTSLGDLRAQVDYAWDARIYTSGLAGRGDLGMLNARLSLHIDDADADVAIFGRNLTNQTYSAYSVSLPQGFTIGIAGQPRIYGIEATKRF